MVRIDDAPGLHIRDMTIIFVPTWLDFSSGLLLWIRIGVSDAAALSYEEPEGGRGFCLHIPRSGNSKIYGSSKRASSAILSSWEGCTDVFFWAGLQAEPYHFTDSLSQLGLSLLLLVYVSVFGLRL